MNWNCSKRTTRPKSKSVKPVMRQTRSMAYSVLHITQIKIRSVLNTLIKSHMKVLLASSCCLLHVSCTALIILLLFIKSTVYCPAHFILLYFLSIIYIYVYCVVTYNCTVHWADLTYISLLIIFCIIVYVTNKTLNWIFFSISFFTKMGHTVNFIIRTYF